MGIRLSIGKCSIFPIRIANKTWYQINPQLQVGPEQVPYASSEEVIRYLGVNLRPWTELDRTRQNDERRHYHRGSQQNNCKNGAQTISEVRTHQDVSAVPVHPWPRSRSILDGSTGQHRRRSQTSGEGHLQATPDRPTVYSIPKGTTETWSCNELRP